MIPLFAVVAVRTAQGDIRIWAPLFLVWPLLALMLVLLSPLILIAWLAMGINPLAATAALLGLVWALPGARVEIESPRTRVLVRVI